MTVITKGKPFLSNLTDLLINAICKFVELFDGKCLLDLLFCFVLLLFFPPGDFISCLLFLFCFACEFYCASQCVTVCV